MKTFALINVFLGFVAAYISIDEEPLEAIYWGIFSLTFMILFVQKK